MTTLTPSQPFTVFREQGISALGKIAEMVDGSPRSRQMAKLTRQFESKIGVCRPEMKLAMSAIYIPKDPREGGWLTADEVIELNENDRIFVCLTEQKFGFYRSRWFSKQRGVIDLAEITKIDSHVDNLEIKIQAPSFKMLRVRFDRKSNFDAFLKSLVRSRRTVIGIARDSYEQLLNVLHLGPDEKLKLLAKVAKNEPFHPSIPLWRMVMWIESGQRDQIVDYLINEVEQWQPIAEQHPGRFANLLVDVKLKRSELLELFSRCSIDSRSKAIGGLMLGTGLLLRQGEFEQAATLADVVQRQLGAVSSSVTEREITAWRMMVHRLTEPYKCQIDRQHLDFSWATPSDLPSTSTIAFQVGMPVTLTAIEKNWANVIFDYGAVMLPVNRCEMAWRYLRAQNLDAAWKSIGVSTSRYWSRVQSIVPPCDPRYFMASLVAGELECHQGLDSAASERVAISIDQAARECPVFAQESNHPMLSNSFTLSRFFGSLAAANHDRADIYADHLAEEFPWCRSLVDLVPAAAPRFSNASTAEENVRGFIEWVESSVHESGVSHVEQIQSECQQLVNALDDDRIRVIVGGETSAGKSTFINRLIGCEVLVSDRQEATAVPTHLVYADQWSAKVEFADHQEAVEHEFGASAVCPIEVNQLIRRYGVLGSECANKVNRIEVSGPISVLAEGIELIDSPGLNAQLSRTELANDALGNSHLCLFVMDARNALKGGEMEAIDVSREMLGRTIFVLNKADLVSSGNEFDLDDNAIDEVQQYVRSQLVAVTGSDSTAAEIYCVSSIDEGYDETFRQLGDRLNQAAKRGKQEPLMFRASRLARDVAGLAIRLALDEVKQCELRLGATCRNVPSDTKSIESFLIPRVKASWDRQRDDYFQAVDQTLTNSISKTRRSVESGVSCAESLEGITKFLKSSLASKLRGVVDKVDNARQFQSEFLARTIFEEISNYFRELYADFDFEYEIDVEELVGSASPMPLPACHGLFSEIDEKISEIGGRLSAGAVIGGVIGTFFAPGIGTAVGAGIGGAFGAATASDEAKQEIVKMAEAKITTFWNQISDALLADLDSDGGRDPRMLSVFVTCVEREARRFISQLNQRKHELRSELTGIESDTLRLEALAVDAAQWRRVLSASPEE